MRPGLYLTLVQALDAAYCDELSDEADIMDPSELLDHVLEHRLHNRTFDEVPHRELRMAVQDWQERNFG